MNDCEHIKSKCTNSRVVDPFHRWRRRECLDCGHRWTTMEVPVDMENSANKGNDGVVKSFAEQYGLSKERVEFIDKLMGLFKVQDND